MTTHLTHEIRVTVDGLSIAVAVHLPAGDSANGGVIFAFAGAGYQRNYWDIAHPSGSFSHAAWNAARGFITIAIDHPGTGDSEGDASVTLERIAAIDAAAVRLCLQRLEEGGLLPGLAPMARPRPYALGQSMGGYLLVLMQAADPLFRAIALLGVAMQGVTFPILTPLGQPARLDHRPDSEEGWRYAFHWEVDENREMVDRDMASGRAARLTDSPWGGRAVPAEVERLLRPLPMVKEAAAIAVPVFIAMGERDTCAEPHREPGFFTGSNDVSLWIQPGAAHMHNFGPGRTSLWQRVTDFFATR